MTRFVDVAYLLEQIDREMDRLFPPDIKSPYCDGGRSGMAFVKSMISQMEPVASYFGSSPMEAVIPLDSDLSDYLSARVMDALRKEADHPQPIAPMVTINPPSRAGVLERAKACVCGQREQDYGSPEDNFRLIASLWAAYTGHEYSPVDVAMMMGLLKIARIKSGGGSGDSFVDLAGYAACAGEIWGRERANDE